MLTLYATHACRYRRFTRFAKGLRAEFDYLDQDRGGQIGLIF